MEQVNGAGSTGRVGDAAAIASSIDKVTGPIAGGCGVLFLKLCAL